ncbi:unnamed protein product [Penicillium viridicatum]
MVSFCRSSLFSRLPFSYRLYIQPAFDRFVISFIGPGYQSTAVPHDTYGVPVYTVIANLVDYPACVIPYGSSQETSDADFVRDVEYHPPYLPKEVENAPCHVQLIGRRQKDEVLMQHALIVEEALAN